MSNRLRSAVEYSLIMFASIGIGLLLAHFITRFEVDVAFSSQNWVIEVTIFVISYFVSITIHELCHALIFVIGGMKMRLIAIFFFAFMNDGSHWSVRFFPNNVTSLGGIAVPDIQQINDDTTFRKIRDVYCRSLLFAPMVSFLIAVISCILIIYLYLMKAHTNYNSIVIVLLAFSAAINSLIFVSAFFKIGNILGDFQAYKFYKSNDTVAKLQLAQYMLFGSNWKKNMLESTWLNDQLGIILETFSAQLIKPEEFGIFDFLIQLDYLQLRSLTDKEASVLIRIFNNNTTFNSRQSEQRDEFYYHLLMILIDKEWATFQSVSVDYAERQDTLLRSLPVKAYYDHLAEYKIFGIGTSEWLYQNMMPNSEYPFLKIFTSVTDNECAIIERKA